MADIFDEIDSVINTGAPTADDPDPNETVQTTDDDNSDDSAYNDARDYVMNLPGDDDDEDASAAAKEKEKQDEEAATKAREKLSLDPEKVEEDRKRKEQEAAQQKQQEEPKTPDDKNEEGKRAYLDAYLREDENNNLVLSDGTIVAASGKARTFLQNLRAEGRQARARSQQLLQFAHQAKERVDDLTAKLEKAKPVPIEKQLEETHGMSAQDTSAMIAIAKDYKQNPIKAIKAFLTKAKMDGINLQEIGVSNSIDAAVVREELERRYGSQAQAATTNQSEQPSNDDAVASATKQVQEFFTTFPEAREHEATIARAKQAYPEMPLARIWFEFSQWQARNNYSKPGEEPNKPATPTKDRFGRETSAEPTTPKPQQPAPTPRAVAKPKRDIADMSFEEMAHNLLRSNGA